MVHKIQCSEIIQIHPKIVKIIVSYTGHWCGRNNHTNYDTVRMWQGILFLTYIR